MWVKRIACLASVGGIVLWICLSATIPGILTCTPSSIQIQGIREGEKRDAVITLTNPGQTPIAITSCRTSCSTCVSVVECPRTILPGSSLPLTFRIDTIALGPYEASQKHLYLTWTPEGSQDQHTQDLVIDIQQVLAMRGLPVASVEACSVSATPVPVTIANHGNGPLEVRQILVPEGVCVEPSGADINPGGQQVFQVSATQPLAPMQGLLEPLLIFMTDADHVPAVAVALEYTADGKRLHDTQYEAKK